MREPLDQLTGMAAHESLHVYVNIKGLAEDGDVRQLFADLKGYDEFSEERFMTTAMGVVPPQSARAGDDRELFFAFIDERNFLDGMTGGHSRDNIEEFCVSLFHSMMFLERFEQNLDHSLSVPGMTKQGHFLTLEEKAAITESYVGAVQVMSEALKERNPGSHRNVPDPSQTFVKGKLAEARTRGGRPVQSSLSCGLSPVR